jgi:biopolymer transport protein ExbB/TolQ
MMSSARGTCSDKRASRPEKRPALVLAALMLGLPLAAGILSLIHFGPLRDTVARRYVSHPVEYVEVVMFCAALGALGFKLLRHWTERRACLLEILPRWDGRAIPVNEAGKLLAALNNLPASIQNSVIVRRTAAVLDFLCSRGSADDLDDHLRSLADNDTLALEGSYSLTRFITWAIPILGFLGTVLGITGAISGVTPEVLENSLSTVTDGLALAFDATALALGLTMVVMFVSSVVERTEQGILDAVDRFVDRELAHRFERGGRQESELLGLVRRHTESLLQGMEKLVEQQTDLWAKAMEEADRRRLQAEHEQQERLASALTSALERTLETHAQRLAQLEKQAVEGSTTFTRQLTELVTSVRDSQREQQQALARLQEGDTQLRQLEQTLNQNLAALHNTGTFEEALHSLTAAIHLLTARAAPRSDGTLRPPAGAAA